MLQVLINLSQCLIVHLQSRMEGWDENRTLIGDIFLHLVSQSTSVYPLLHHENCAPEIVCELEMIMKFSPLIRECEFVLKFSPPN